jgi:hypothetical protein
MKKDDVPQDLGALGKISKEVCYATDTSGRYVTELSKGWDIKINALDVAWKDIEDRVATARQKVISKHASPLLFFMERGMMDIRILAGYTGFAKWQIKRHLRPAVFEKLAARKLQRYAEAFNISVDDLKNIPVNDQ